MKATAQFTANQAANSLTNIGEKKTAATSAAMARLMGA